MICIDIRGGIKHVLFPQSHPCYITLPSAHHPPHTQIQQQLQIFAGGITSSTELAALAKEQFHLDIEPSFEVVPLRGREALLPNSYPRFTLLRQTLAAARVAAGALRRAVPALWVDSTGWAATFPVARLAGARVAAYVHYPTVSSSMISRVASREPGFNNDELSRSVFGAAAKVAYYSALVGAYALCGTCAQCVMVNSSWTRRHIAGLWPGHRWPDVVYPPCNTEDLQGLPLNRKLKRMVVLSVSQFRPEKQHALQLRAFARARALAADSDAYDGIVAARLKLVGGCRGAGDAQRVSELRGESW